MSNERLERIFETAATLRNRYDKYTLALYLAARVVTKGRAVGGHEKWLDLLVADLDKIKGTKKTKPARRSPGVIKRINAAKASHG